MNNRVLFILNYFSNIWRILFLEVDPKKTKISHCLKQFFRLVLVTIFNVFYFVIISNLFEKF